MAGERTVLRLRRHALCLLPAAGALLVLAGSAVALAVRVPSGPGRLVVALVAGVMAVRLVLVPLARWRATTYLLTDRRVAAGRGVVHRVRRDVLLAQVRGVTVTRRWWHVPLGAGSVVVRGAAAEPLVLADVPRARLLRDTVLAAARAAADAGEVADAARAVDARRGTRVTARRGGRR